MANETLFPMPPMPEKALEREVEGLPRLVSPNRSQLELRPIDLESLLSEDHPARAVWAFVESLDLEPIYGKIRSVEGRAGRPATDPRVLLALWIFATTDGVGSARALERLTEQHDAYRWICGGVSVNYHSLADFRVQHGEYLKELLTRSVAVLMAEGLVTLQRVAQDGVRVRASAGAASFRRRRRLEDYLREAGEQVERLAQELEEDPGATSRRQAAARKRSAEDRRRRVEAALGQMAEVESKKKPQERESARASTTDAEARVMKMADGGFRPAYNGQFAVDTASQIVVGVDVSNLGSDQGRLGPMLDQMEERYRRLPQEGLVDGGFAGLRDVEQAAQRGVRIYAPVVKPKDPDRDAHQPLARDSEAIAEWRQRMGTEQAKQIYKDRAATVECVNALARNRGLQRLLVRGKEKVHAVLLWFALAHNVMRGLSLRAALDGVTA
jgi:transposase